MKLRRSLALAAATAVLSPVVLMTASVAQAEENPSSSTTATESASTGETEPEGDVTTTPATSTSTPAATDTSTPPAQNSTSAAPTKDAASASASTSNSTSPSASASASASASTGPEDCDETDPKLDKDLSTSLSGLPSKIVAGSGFHGFKLNVKNSGKHSYKRVDLGVFAAAMGEDDFSDATQYLTLQYQDPTTGKWNDISVDLDDEAAGYLGYTDVKAKESFSIDLRLSVDKKAPAGAASPSASVRTSTTRATASTPRTTTSTSSTSWPPAPPPARSTTPPPSRRAAASPCPPPSPPATPRSSPRATSPRPAPARPSRR